ncbi:MAG: threonine/serine dehydratase [Deinococcota bacterium]
MTSISSPTETTAPTTIPTSVSLQDIETAQQRIVPAIYRTPLVQLDAGLYAKAENLQRTNAFKLRGAYNFLAQLDEDARKKGVVAYSSGNHAQGVACAAHLLNIPATIVIPNNAPEVKVVATERWGATVIRCDNDHSIRERLAKEIVTREGRTLVPPFDHPWIVAGQGTTGLEIVDDLPDVANVLVCTGGGGLLAGVAVAIKERNPNAKVFGVEPELAADAAESFNKGERTVWESSQVSRTIADGVRTIAVGKLNFALMQQYVDGIITVSEDAIEAATYDYAVRHRMVVEPTGALTLAALPEATAQGQLQEGSTVLMVSGGNVDLTWLANLLAHHTH